MIGTLFIVATPIGNMQDITFRAIETLKTVDLILAEDTRRTGLLLQHYTILTPMVPFHEHNEHEKKHEVLEKLRNGRSLALVSDAGTPLVSDPGYTLVRACIKENIPVVSIPGAVSAITALTSSGLPPDKFLFIGFLPEKQSKRQTIFAAIKAMRDDEEGIHPTVIIYESPYHLKKALEDLKDTLGNIQIVIARELTKIHEEIFHGTIDETLTHFQNPKGEFVILI